MKIKLTDAMADGDSLEQKGINELQEMAKPKRQPLVAGVNGFPTDPPPESIIVGNGLIRHGDIAMLNSGAGMGKSVGMGQMAMAWGLGLPYFGIKPSRPLRIIHYVGEDDESTMGQIREGFLLHSLAITGKQLTAKDLEPLDKMLMTQFDRSAIGDFFIAELKNDIEAVAPDFVFINPLLSYIGGDPVQLATPFLRAGIMPALAANKCAALIAHHTCKLNRDSWNTMDPTYSGIGGSEMANIPRVILTMMPAGDSMVRLQASKRTTTGWKDDSGKHMTHAFFRRTDNPTRPAWLPVSYDEAEAAKDQQSSDKKSPKCSWENVRDALQFGDASQQSLIARLDGSDRTVRDAIDEAVLRGVVESYQAKNPKGGKPIKWLRLVRDEPEQVVNAITS